MLDILNLDDFPLDKMDSPEWRALVAKCQLELSKNGLFNLSDFIRPEAVDQIIEQVVPVLAQDSFTHARRHNIYFKKSIDGLAADHPALQEFETSNRTICADQIGKGLLIDLYEYPPFAAFLAAVMGLDALYPMGDPLARVNVMGYSAGQALNWHFDRSEFTTTLLLQAPSSGGEFEYDQDLRSDNDPNYDGVADLLNGRRAPKRMPLSAGSLNVFKGKNTAHRVTPVQGGKDRIIAVFSYFDRPDVMFSDEERIGFYGRAS